MANRPSVQTKSTKLNEGTNRENTPDMDKLFRNVTREISKEVIDFTVRKAVRSSEIQRKYPPVPDNIQKLSEPTKATYISLYNKYRNVLKPQTVGKVKEKIAEYLKKIEEMSVQEKTEKEAEIHRRKKRKSKAMKEKKETEFTEFCLEICDALFELFLNKFTEFLMNQREIPKPLILAPSSLKLYQNIQELLTNLISPRYISKTRVIEEPTERLVMDETEVVTVKVETEKQLVLGAEQTKEIAETKEIVDSLSYFIMEFIQNSLVEAV